MKTLHLVAPRKLGNTYYRGRDEIIKQMLKMTTGISVFNYDKQEVNNTGDWDVVCDDDALISEEA